MLNESIKTVYKEVEALLKTKGALLLVAAVALIALLIGYLIGQPNVCTDNKPTWDNKMLPQNGA